ncbi:MAG: hypothetical protein J4400_01480, partial [Candidatus Aenigmarchaeota archaeon]|nr:hypothetical protein [Candidatus Aenigmarchaeota archaeon]
LKEPGHQRLVFYVPDSISDYAIAMYSGFGRPPKTYERMGQLAAESGRLAVISDWDDGRHFTESTMIDAVYYPIDWLRNEIGKSEPRNKFRCFFGIGHSFGGERLLKAALTDKEKRFAAVAVVQPPERLGKYIREHQALYTISKTPYARALAVPVTLASRPELHVFTLVDQANLIRMIDDDSSLFDAIKSAPEYRTPTQILCASSDGHVDYKDATEAAEMMKNNGAKTELVHLDEFYKRPTDKQMEDVFGHISDFFDRISRDPELAA